MDLLNKQEVILLDCIDMLNSDLYNSVQKRTNSLFECSDVCSVEKLKKYKELIQKANELLHEAYDMGMRDDN